MGEIFKISHKLLDSLPTSIVFTDIHSRILYVNPQAESFFGYRRDEIIGQRLRLLFFEEDLLFLYPNILYLTIYRSGFDGEVLLRQKDGRRLFVHLCTTSFKEDGEIFLTFAFQKIQRQKDLEHEKLKLQRWVGLGRMVEEIVHQFRRPLSSIGGFTQRLLQADPLPSRTQTSLRRIGNEAKRLEALLKGLEEYAELPTPVFHPESLEAVVRDAIAHFSKTMAPPGIPIRLDTRGLSGDGKFFVDRKLIQKALLQVFANGLEAIRRKSKGRAKAAIDVILRDDGEIIEISVRDRGIGISKKHRDLIFEPFFSTDGQRVGLGLTLVQKIMEEHGGRISIESRPNRGTRVHLFFPKDRRRKLRRESIFPPSLRQKEY